MAGNNRSGRSIKDSSIRDRVISLRMAYDDVEYLDKLCAIRKDAGKAFCSRTDIILIALQELDLNRLR